MGHNSLRIIGGKWRGRKLSFPDGAGLRPTHDRIRETLFNWLMHDVAGARCLDMFAGSGALGLEALSRGAASVTFIDNNRQAAADLKTHCLTLQADHAVVLCEAFQQVSVNQLGGPFTIVFLDPPFGQSLLLPACQWLVQHDLLCDGASIYIEVEKNGLPAGLPVNWEQSRFKSTAALDYYLFKFHVI